MLDFKHNLNYFFQIQDIMHNYLTCQRTNMLVSNEPRLKHLPAPLFAVIMGLSGLTIVFQKAASIFDYPQIFGNIFAFLTTSAFIGLSFAYLMKFINYRQAVINEFNHPIRLNFFPAFSICLLLLSIIFEHISPSTSQILWFIGTPIHFGFTIYVVRFWIVNNFEITHSNPAWFIPIVGNVLVPILGAKYAGVEVATFFFSIGMFFWIVMFSIILNRIIFHHQLAAKFLPTLFIFIAPAGIGCIAYQKIDFAMTGTMQMNMLGYALFDIGLFFTILLFAMWKEFAKIGFAITWWAYTFPMAAITIATIMVFSITKNIGLFWLSQLLIAITTSLVLLVMIKTIKAVKNKEVCIKE